MPKGLLIPADSDQPIREFEVLDEDDPNSLDVLQKAVGGFIEAVRLPRHVDPDGQATAYINEEGKFDTDANPPNMRATDLMVPGVGLFVGDWIAGPMLLVGFDPQTGTHRDLPAKVREAIEVVAAEAAL